MEEEKTREEKLILSYRMNKLKVWTNIFLILLFLAIFIYMILNVEALKILNYDICQLCIKKTGATCFNPIKFP